MNNYPGKCELAFHSSANIFLTNSINIIKHSRCLWIGPCLRYGLCLRNCPCFRVASASENKKLSFNKSAASKEFFTIVPHAIIAKSLPSLKIFAFPKVKSKSSKYTAGFGAPPVNRIYTDCSCSIAAKTALTVAPQSAGETTVIPGIDLIMLISSMQQCV